MMALRWRDWLTGISIIATLNLGVAQERDASQPSSATGAIGLEQVLGEHGQAGFAVADPTYVPTFPRDHGAHPRFRHEWWYLTGNLWDEQGRRYGYQWTLFRFALRPEAEIQDSAWRGDQLYMGHAALSVAQSQSFYHRERFSRDALDLAGAQAAPLTLWLLDWRLQGQAPTGEPPWQLQVRDKDFALDLQLSPMARERVLQGEQGYSRKGRVSATHYYSYTRLPTQGEIMVEGERISVSGESWFDREWGSGALETGQQGWDWFALHLDDGRDVMWYQLRHMSGGVDEASSGIVVWPDGRQRALTTQDVQIQVEDYWQAPDGTCYPAAWELSIADLPRLRLRPLLPQQWWDGRFRYWEGAARVMGNVGGHAYVELSGYSPVAECP